MAIARPGLLTSLENFGQIMEENILKIINNPTGIKWEFCRGPG